MAVSAHFWISFVTVPPMRDCGLPARLVLPVAEEGISHVGQLPLLRADADLPLRTDGVLDDELPAVGSDIRLLSDTELNGRTQGSFLYDRPGKPLRPGVARPFPLVVTGGQNQTGHQESEG